VDDLGKVDEVHALRYSQRNVGLLQTVELRLLGVQQLMQAASLQSSHRV
jgi:hypothetical protein